MKVQVIRKDGKAYGWTILAENEAEMRTLGTIRNMQFFGMNETAIGYAGVKSDSGYAVKLAWCQRCIIKEFSFSNLDENNNLIIKSLSEE